MDLGLEGTRSVITRVSKGIGRVITNVFADKGADVAICARETAEVDAAVAALETKVVKVCGQAVR